MKTIGAFTAGMIAGLLLLGTAIAQTGRIPAGTQGVNHVGMVVEHYQEAFDFYTNVLGLREAYTVDNANGTPLLSYLQLNRETFVELIPARAGQSSAITHYGMEVGDIDATVQRLRDAGYEVGDPGLTPAQARFVRVHDPNGIEIEIMEYGPDALQRKAIDSWQP